MLFSIIKYTNKYWLGVMVYNNTGKRKVDAARRNWSQGRAVRKMAAAPVFISKEWNVWNNNMLFKKSGCQKECPREYNKCNKLNKCNNLNRLNKRNNCNKNNKWGERNKDKAENVQKNQEEEKSKVNKQRNKDQSGGGKVRERDTYRLKPQWVKIRRAKRKEKERKRRKKRFEKEKRR